MKFTKYMTVHLLSLWCFSSQIKVDCITVNTNPVKAVIDDHIQRLFDALLNSLRKAISTEVNTIDAFLKEAMETLSKRPQSVEEIGEANGKHSEFLKKKKEVKIKIKLIQSKLLLLFEDKKLFIVLNNGETVLNYLI